MKRICPIATLKERIGVPTLITASADDERVPFAGVLKWVEQARALSHGQDKILLNQIEGGHFGYQADIHSIIIQEYAFVIKHLCSGKVC